MKCKELKELLKTIDDNTEIAVHIQFHNPTAEHLCNPVNDTIHNRIILEFIEDDKII